MPDVLDEVLHRALTSQPRPEPEVVLGTAAAALLLVVLPGVWVWTRTVVTIAHEGSHALAAVLSGRRLSGVRLHRDTSGLTLTRGRPRGPGMVLTAAAGYVGPGLMGLGAAVLLSLGYAVGLLWVAFVALVVLLLFIRNAWGLLAVLVVGGGVLAVSWWGSAHTQLVVAHVATWFLLLAAPRPVVELQARRRHGGAASSDADILARLTPLPGLFWVGVFLLATVGSLVAGGALLLGRIGFSGS